MLDDFEEGTTSGEPSAGGGGRNKLMESGSIRTGGGACGECSITRGMPAISADGEEVGRVAAVVLDAAGTSTGLVISLLLGCARFPYRRDGLEEARGHRRPVR